MIRRGFVVVAIFAMVPWATRPAAARVVEKIAAVVGDEVILDSEVREKSEPFMQEIAAIPNPQQRTARVAALRHEILDRLIDDHLMVQHATEMKLSVTSEEIDRAIEQIKKQQGFNDQKLMELLRQSGTTMAAYRQDLKRQLVSYKVVQIAVGSKVNVSDTDVQAYYDRHLKSGANVQVRAAHIFLVIPENADNAVVREREQIAAGLLERAKKGEDFAKLAKEFSEDPATRNEGGDLGYFGRGMLPKPIEEMVFAMKVGEVRGPARADRGFHVIKLIDRKEKETAPLTQIREELRAQLRDKELERQRKIYLNELRKKTLVDIRL